MLGKALTYFMRATIGTTLGITQGGNINYWGQINIVENYSIVKAIYKTTILV